MGEFLDVRSSEDATRVTGKRILVVDDAAGMRRMLADYILRPAGYDVLTGRDGAEGLTLALDLRPDLLIVDDRMPRLGGLEMLSALNQEGLHIPAILITAQGSERLGAQAAQAGVCTCLRKPFDPDQILQAVQRALTGQALPHVRPSQALQKRLRELDTLSRLAGSLTSQLELEEVLNRVVEAAVTLTGAEEGSLLLVEQESGDLYMRAAKNFDEDMARSFRLEVSDSLAGEVIRSRMPIVLSSATAHKIRTSYMVKGLIYVPLIMEGEAIGVLGVDNRIATRSFDRHHVRLLTALADYAVIAVRNANLYSQTQHERDTLDAILHNTEDVVVVVDIGGKVLLCNPTARNAFAINGTDVTGKKLDELIDHPEVLKLFARQGLAGRGYTTEIQLESGQTLNAQMTVIEGVGRAVVMQDITHLKELDRVKSEFVTTVSHDLRSPLTAILGYVELVERTGELNETQREFIDRMICSVQSITALISDLLELGRVEAGFNGDLEPTPMQIVIRHAVEAQQQRLEAEKLHLSVEVPGDLPEVLGNPLHLRQMLANLLENAIKYTPEGGHITIRAQAEGDMVVLEVSDDGAGISLKDQPHIFEKFYRARNAGHLSTGTGLGLSIVKSIVERHGGRVWVQSREGEGSTFTIVLPISGATQVPGQTGHAVVAA